MKIKINIQHMAKLMLNLGEKVIILFYMGLIKCYFPVVSGSSKLQCVCDCCETRSTYILLWEESGPRPPYGANISLKLFSPINQFKQDNLL